jgi:hypothetical protein
MWPRRWVWTLLKRRDCLTGALLEERLAVTHRHGISVELDGTSRNETGTATTRKDCKSAPHDGFSDPPRLFNPCPAYFRAMMLRAFAPNVSLRERLAA